MASPRISTTLPDHAVELRALTKTYPARKSNPAKEALRGITLDIQRGSIFGLLGPNGAGKSTLIGILAGLVRKTAGEARVWGYDVVTNSRQARGVIGVVPQELNLDAFFTPRELLDMQAGIFGVPKHERITQQLLDAVELSNKSEAYARTLSGGMRRRLMVAKAMVHSPPILVLDEPTAGVDVELRRSLWDYVRRLNAAGTTILLTTHYLEEAEELCDHIAIIDQGNLVANERKESLLRHLDSKQITLVIDREVVALPPALAEQGWKITAPRQITLSYKPSKLAVGDILLAVQAQQMNIIDLSTKEADLETIFLQLTSKKSQNGNKNNKIN